MILLVTVLIFGCSVKKDFVPISGNRAGGTVLMGYSYALFEKPETDNAQAVASAAQRCRAWGYQRAEPFGAVMSRCTHATGSGCDKWMVTTEFQCIGGPRTPKTEANDLID
jgi:hypothetical protein